MLLTEAIEAVANHDASIQEHPINGTLTFANDCTLVVGEVELHVPPQGMDTFCRHVAAPAAYLKRLDADVRRVVLQRHIDRGDLDFERLTLISRGNEFLSFGRSDLLHINGQEVLQAVQDGVNGDIDVHRLDIGDDAMEADLLVERAAEEVAPGDVIRAGLRITHSFIGEHATWVEAYILRLICANGMTHRECAKRLAARTRRLPVGHKDARQMQIAQVRRLASETAAALQTKLQAIRELHAQPVEVDQMLTRWLERARLSTRLWMPVLREAWETEGSEATSYGVMNALTRVATHGLAGGEREMTSRQRRILSGLAGLLAFQRLHLCPRCFSQLGGPASVVESHGDVSEATGEEGL